MRFSPTLINALILTVAFSGQAFAVQATPVAPPTVEAPTGAPTVKECITADMVDDQIMKGVPDAEIVSVSPDNFTITYSNPSKPTNLEVHFDEEGCFTFLNETV